MKNAFTLKDVSLSAIYLLISIILILLLDLGLEWLYNNVIFSVLDWFNKLSIYLKIIIILFGGALIFLGLLQATGKISTFLGGMIFNRFPQNIFTKTVPMLLSIANAIYYIIKLWKIPDNYDFWIVVELFFISGFIWQLGSIVIPAKEQVKTL